MEKVNLVLGINSNQSPSHIHATAPCKVTNKLQQRYYLIELLAYWEGRVNTKDLERHFDQSRQQSSGDIKHYKELAPNNLIYNSAQKAYIPSDSFQAHYISSDVHDYLHWLHSGQFNTSNAHQYSAALAVPARHISPHIMRGLIAAIRQQKRIDVDYVSLRKIWGHENMGSGLRFLASFFPQYYFDETWR